MVRFLSLAIFAFFLLISLSLTLAVPNVVFKLEADFTAIIQVNSATWLRTAATWFTANGKRYSTADKSLTLASTANTAGVDALGHFNATILTWTADSGSLSWQTIYRLYLHHSTPPSLRAIVFDQLWVSGATGTSVNDSNAVLSAFPAFIPSGSEVTLGALQWYSAFDQNVVFQWSGHSTSGNESLHLSNGGESGPLVLFDAHAQVSVTLSPFSQFMSASLALSSSSSLSSHTKPNTAAVAEYGVAGSMESVPAGYMLSTIAVFGDSGLTNNVLAWGDALLAQYGKQRMAMYEEITTQYLGYSTDNGAFYYYNTEPGKNYEDTLLDVYTDYTTRQIPYRHMLLDSYFYYKGHGNGAKNWTAITALFPHGLQSLHSNLTIPFTAHNRWWSLDNDYATVNGGKYQFEFDHNYAGLPLEQIFWDDLFRNASVWGLRNYEQDWLGSVWQSHPPVTTNISLGRNWLIQMGAGARKAGVNIQYCSPFPRHVLQSVEIPNVVQVRASDDNALGRSEADENWRIGESSLLVWALGIAPFKDTFWTVVEEPGNTYNATEISPELQVAVATLSTGPVYPGDKIGYTDIPLLAMAHRTDGLILKPDRPAFSLDVSYASRAFGASAAGPDAAQITHTYSAINGQRWHILMVAEEGHGYQLPLRDVGETSTTAQFVTYYRHNGSLSLPSLGVWDANTPLTLAPQSATTTSFTVFWAAPVLANGLAVLGDVSKWVPMSAQRIVAVTEWDIGVSLQLSGDANEKVSITYAAYSQQQHNKRVSAARGLGAGLAQAAAKIAETLGDWQLQSVDCVLSAAGSARVTIMTQGGVAQCTAN